jgi:hypothetical protein
VLLSETVEIKRAGSAGSAPGKGVKKASATDSLDKNFIRVCWFVKSLYNKIMLVTTRKTLSCKPYPPYVKGPYGCK